jgi:hypothetical protein
MNFSKDNKIIEKKINEKIVRAIDIFTECNAVKDQLTKFYERVDNFNELKLTRDLVILILLITKIFSMFHCNISKKFIQRFNGDYLIFFSFAFNIF